jgi:hypothetical protein
MSPMRNLLKLHNLTILVMSTAFTACALLITKPGGAAAGRVAASGSGEPA